MKTPHDRLENINDFCFMRRTVYGDRGLLDIFEGSDFPDLIDIIRSFYKITTFSRKHPFQLSGT